MRSQISPGISLQYFINRSMNDNQISLNYRTHSHSTQVINIHEMIQGHRFTLGFPCNITYYIYASKLSQIIQQK